jgi:hypothetical protein
MRPVHDGIDPKEERITGDREETRLRKIANSQAEDAKPGPV